MAIEKRSRNIEMSESLGFGSKLVVECAVEIIDNSNLNFFASVTKWMMV